MPLPKPVDRRTLIRKLKKLGFDGPYSGGKHQYMIREQHKLVIPNPHTQSTYPIHIKVILVALCW